MIEESRQRPRFGVKKAGLKKLLLSDDKNRQSLRINVLIH
jgi:hypothetical protein